MSGSEAAAQATILRECGALPGVRLFRNSVGEGWTGRVMHQSSGMVTLEHPRRVSFGWCPGSPDLLGWHSVVVTPDMIGQTIARLVGVEVKHGRGRTSAEQQRFLDMLARVGGVAIVAREPADVTAALGARLGI